METKEYIESGILELYVFGALSEPETAQVAKIASQNKEIQFEILSIEKAIMTLNFSLSQKLSADNYTRIKNKVFDNNEDVIPLDNDLEPSSKNWKSYMGWAAAVVFSVGIGYLYQQNKKIESQVAFIEKEKSKLNTNLDSLEVKNKNIQEIISIFRDDTNSVIALAGQTVAPTAKAKIHWNKSSGTVFVDASGLPEPPEGMEYQIWSLQLNPLTPTSIGMLKDFKENEMKLFTVAITNNAQAFGITLEPKGGSLTPTMEQLYTLGKV